MEMPLSLIQLYELLRAKTDKKTAEEVVAALKNSIKEEVKQETVHQVKSLEVDLSDKLNGVKLDLTEKINAVHEKINDVKTDLIDRINTAKLQTILWVVGVGVLQLVARYLFQ